MSGDKMPSGLDIMRDCDESASKVVDLRAARDAKREENTPHISGEARCLACKHEYVAVAPSGVTWMECPSCHLTRSRFIYQATLRGGEHWHCACENDLFQVTRDGVYCPNCGVFQRFPK